MLICAKYVIPVTMPVMEDAAVLVRDDAIMDIGRAETLRARYPQEEIKDFGSAAIIPGLIDLHSSIEESVMRGFVNDVPYVTWMNTITVQSRKLSGDDWYESSILGCLEALSNGITCVANITPTGGAAKALQDLGMRGVVYREVAAIDKNRVDDVMSAAEDDILKWMDYVDSDRIAVGVAPAPLYACHPLLLKRSRALACEANIPMAMHLAGSREEYNFVKSGSSGFSVYVDSAPRGYMERAPWLPAGTSPVVYAVNWGAFEAPNVLAVHCVHLNAEADLAKLKEYDVAVAVCSRSNAQLGMGVAPLNDLIRAGLRIGLGTDSPAATSTTDIIDEMRVGMLIHRANNVGAFINSHTMLELATIGAARALKQDDRIGSLEAGKIADITVIDLSGSHNMSEEDPISAIVNSCSGNDVLMTMVNGEVLFEDGQFHVDVEIAKNIVKIMRIRNKLLAERGEDGR